MRTPIVGGYLDAATDGVVALAFQTRGQVQVFCSGSLLAPNLVLTARHCIAQIGDGSSEQVDCATSKFTAKFDPRQIFVSTDAQPQKDKTPLYSVKQVLEAPGGTNVCGFDVALLVLGGTGIPSAAATPIVPALGVKTSTDAIFSAVGFGLQDPTDKQGTTAGSRMRFDTAQVYCVGANCPPAAQNQPDEWVGNSPVCSGDSGGPALDSAGRVFGVTSRGDTQCTFALYSNVADWSDFIRSTAQSAASAGGYTAPAWVNGASNPVDAGAAGGAASGGMSGSSTGGRAAGGGATSGGASNGGGSTSSGGSSGGGSSAGGASSGGSSSGASSSGGASSNGVTTATPTPPAVQTTAPTVDPLGQECAGDCPGTYKCYSANGSPPGVCVPPCSASGASCPASYECSSALQACVPAPAVVTKGRVSTSCSVNRVGSLGDGENESLAAMLVFGALCLARRRRHAA